MKRILLITSVALLTACSGMSTLKTENTKQKQVPDWYLDHADVGTESKSIFTPWDRQGMFYAVAEDVSPSMEMAMKKATLKAKAKIVDRVNGEMNNRTTIKYDEDGTVDKPTGRAQAQDVIVNLIAESVLRTYGVDTKMIVYNPEMNNYRAFVRLKISQKDVATLAEAYDTNKQAKIKGRVGGLTIDESASEVLKQAQR
jgi:hypothetical protein